MKKVIPALALLFSSLPQAETLYVVDEIRVGLRAEANSSSKTITVEPTGAPLEVIKRESGYILVKTSEGKEGWIHKNYTLTEKPARERIVEVQAALDKALDEHRALSEDHQKLMEELDKLKSERETQNKELTASRDQVNKLKGELAQYTASDEPGEKMKIWLALAGAATALFLLGVFVGFNNYKKRVARRLGGMHL